MKAQFLLVAYDVAKEKVPSNAARKYISKEEFQTLQQDYFCSLELDNIKVDIINRMCFHLARIEGHTMIMVIEYKKA